MVYPVKLIVLPECHSFSGQLPFYGCEMQPERCQLFPVPAGCLRNCTNVRGLFTSPYRPDTSVFIYIYKYLQVADLLVAVRNLSKNIYKHLDIKII